MIDELKLSNRYNETKFMMYLAMFCISLSLFRYIYTDSRVFLFLIWNLFLAIIPWVLTTLVTLRPNLQKSKVPIIALLLIWLLFFPNAPYIFTDLLHMSNARAYTAWFDLVLILSYAWAGIMLGLLSLLDIETILKKKLSSWSVNIITSFLLFLASFGVYLGRFLRWNSWDIIQEPLTLLTDISTRLLNPLDHPRTWGFTLVMGIFLNFMYWSFKIIKKRVP
jgi:uncharacterized membrane protein